MVKGKEVVSKTISFSHELDEGCDEATKGGRRTRLSKNPKIVASFKMIVLRAPGELCGEILYTKSF